MGNASMLRIINLEGQGGRGYLMESYENYIGQTGGNLKREIHKDIQESSRRILKSRLLQERKM
jgi:hypothetical protein